MTVSGASDSGIPTFVAVGHVTHDLVDGSTMPGGAVYYSTLSVRALGVRVGALTSVGPDFAHHDALESVSLRVKSTETTTCFENRYDRGRRTQRMCGLAALLEPADLPERWRRAKAAYLCPVMGEVDLTMAQAFPEAIVGIGAQGWMRLAEPSGLVRAKRWRPEPRHLLRIRLAVLSDEDTAADPELVDHLRTHVPLVAYTHGADGCELFIEGRPQRVPVYPTEQVGPTGAGDVFGGTMLAALNWGHTPVQAAYLASCAASIVVEAVGGEALERMGETWERLRAYGDLHRVQVRDMGP